MKKPIIGVVADVSKETYMEKELTQFAIYNDYNTAVLKFGGIPICITPTKQIDYKKTPKEEITPITEEEKEDLIEALKLCDGVIMPGGLRSFEHNYVIDTYLKENNIPTLGVCLGMQIMAINSSKEKLGDIEDKSHFRCVHDVYLKDGLLKNIIKEDKIKVNSYHNHMVVNPGAYKVVATSSDGIIEAIEDDDALFRIGVQWHPEKNIEDENSKKILKAFINAANVYKATKK